VEYKVPFNFLEIPGRLRIPVRFSFPTALYPSTFYTYRGVSLGGR